MHRHGSTCLEGPVSRRRPVWANGPPAAADDNTPVRADLVARVRREIAEGTYDTPDKWEAALDRLLDRLEWA